MKNITKCIIIFIILSALFSCNNNKLIEKNVVYTTGKEILLESIFGDVDPTKIINTVSLIIKGTVTEAKDPFYLENHGFPRFNYTIKVNEIIKGNNIVSVGDEITMGSFSGYIKFKTYASTADNTKALQYAFPESEYQKYIEDDNAYVACHFQDNVIPEEGKEYIFLLIEYDGKNNDCGWMLWSDRSSTLLIKDNMLEGYATKMFGNTYDEFKQTVDIALQTPEIKYY